jgi:membrane protein implicated in regulation of membrane protease activity
VRVPLNRLIAVDATLVVVFLVIAFASRHHQSGPHWWIASISWYAFVITLLILILLVLAWAVRRFSRRRRPAV